MTGINIQLTSAEGTELIDYFEDIKIYFEQWDMLSNGEL